MARKVLSARDEQLVANVSEASCGYGTQRAAPHCSQLNKAYLKEGPCQGPNATDFREFYAQSSTEKT